MGKALEEDEQFWNAGIFAEGSDEDYQSKDESDAKDSFDSDFDEPDRDIEQEEEGSDDGKKRK